MPIEVNHPTVNFRPKSSGDTGSDSSRRSGDTHSGDWSGRVFGEYEVQRLVGQGGNGQVYRAQHRWLQMPVAIKVLQHVNTNDEQTLERFRREAQIAAKLRHPNLVRCTDGGVVGEKLFLVTDYVDGEDLRTLVRRQGPLSVPDACEIIRQTAIALQYIVDHEMIHRDIKPANVMLDRDATVRVLDMGLARCTISGETLTETGQVMGTLDYIAPEQALDSRRVDFRADLYSLGCTFYFLLTGQAPFCSVENETMASKILAHLESDHPPIKSFRRDVPRVVIDLIDQMLNKTPEARPSSFDAIRIAVQAHAQQHDLGSLLAETNEIKPVGDRTSVPHAANFTDRIGDGIRSALKSVFRWVLVGIGVLDRTPASRPGQKPTYHFSFRWFKAVMAFGLLGFVVWYSGFRFVSHDAAPARVFDDHSINAPSLESSRFSPIGPPPHPSPLSPAVSPSHPRPPGNLPPPPHQPPRRSQDVQFNAFIESN